MKQKNANKQKTTKKNRALTKIWKNRLRICPSADQQA